MAVDQRFDLDLRVHERTRPGGPAIVAADFSDEGSECHRTDEGACATSHCTSGCTSGICSTEDCETQPHNGCKTDAHCPGS